ncbi:FecCD family ABC transporter permease [Micromonospora parathelypteridis]|uniref:Iron complex transport system permease protein n=1 Tax=Micromonospora parathelypteridis TaxID=1839617 RepID=A0A840VHF6_9ACTN|nr:iron chelate uptake ABC transporter family permease subunit [Micromonospora parathelypteridis]MBB5476187.1 iron complex transport system permease protein [Micromonospora parathelypteridis]GGO13848.1 iron ABC transporter [Micromonospora parathelypteridis]
MNDTLTRSTAAEPAGLALPGRTVIRIGPVSAAVPARGVAVTLVALLGAVALAVVSVCHGDFPITPPAVWEVLTGGGTRIERHIVLNLRLPRVLCALLVGAALAVAGALTQTFARNPLASPDVLGVTNGAAVGAVAAIVLGGAVGAYGVPLAALGGAAISATLIYLLAWRRGIDGYRLVLIGLGVGEILGGITSWLLIRADLVDATRATIWITGSLAGREWAHVRPLAAALAVLLPLAMAASVALRVLQFREDTARALGLRLQSAQLLVVALAAALAAAAVAAAGPIEFVAFLVPQVALRLCGGSRPPLLASALLGALLVVGADLAAQIVIAPKELPVGLLTAMIGTPYLLWLLLRRSRRTSG